MDEAAARHWLTDALSVSRETVDRLDQFVAMLREEMSRQNLISAASADHIFARHIVDSAQLLRLAPERRSWLDLGSGAGFPGLILSIIANTPITLVEMRRLRVEWLARVVETLGLEGVSIEPVAVERCPSRQADIITARAFAPLPRLFALAARFATEETVWLLPKGRRAREELESITPTWHGEFVMVPSVTDPDSTIIVGRNIRPRRGSKKR